MLVVYYPNIVILEIRAIAKIPITISIQKPLIPMAIFCIYSFLSLRRIPIIDRTNPRITQIMLNPTQTSRTPSESVI